ncbi:MAG: diguanylate cyclase [Labilithrix sp.]|nr:diguanylate cyclase [Labilithrix sp.]MCW5816476.1 diguanylate cyclase [Labilithrix sp.]
MFWRRKESSTGIPARASLDDDVELNAALDAVGEILRARARHAFPLDGESAPEVEVYEQWAKHILVRSAAPTSPAGEAIVEHRDWRGLVDFVAKRARRENEYVSNSMRDMRNAIFALVDSISKTSGTQGKNDALLRRRVSALGAAVESGSVELLKREAALVADAVNKAIEEARRTAEQQNADLKARLESLGEQLEQTRREGDTDGLTRVANRRAFDLALERALTIASVVKRPVTLIMVDVDRFKSINDQHGHPGGDAVLKAIADTLARSFPRRSDLVARYGGEEFAIVLPDSGDAEVTVLADRLLHAIRALRVRLPSERTLAVTVSAGAAIALPNETASELVVRADRALYASKRAGRNRWCVAPAIAPDVSGAAGASGSDAPGVSAVA